MHTYFINRNKNFTKLHEKGHIIVNWKENNKIIFIIGNSDRERIINLKYNCEGVQIKITEVYHVRIKVLLLDIRYSIKNSLKKSKIFFFNINKYLLVRYIG